MLATMAKDHPFEWERHLQKVCFAYNTSVHASTGQTSFFLMFGRRAQLPLDLVFKTDVSPAMTTPEYAVELKRSLEAAYEKVRQTTVPNRKCRGNSTTDECMGICTRLETTFGYILRYCPERTPRSCIIHGLAYRVIKRLPDSTYRIQLLRAPHKRLVVHFNWLKPCGDA